MSLHLPPMSCWFSPCSKTFPVSSLDRGAMHGSLRNGLKRREQPHLRQSNVPLVHDSVSFICKIQILSAHLMVPTLKRFQHLVTHHCETCTCFSSTSCSQFHMHTHALHHSHTYTKSIHSNLLIAHTLTLTCTVLPLRCSVVYHLQQKCVCVCVCACVEAKT